MPGIFKQNFFTVAG